MIAAVGLWLALQGGAEVSLESLLAELADPAAAARLPEPAYAARSWTSHDRRSVRPGEPSWFANADRNQFQGAFERDGRTEHVLVDAAGPGAVVRVWATWVGGGADPAHAGTLRLYLDGAEEPVVAGEIGAFLSGGLLAGAPFGYSVPASAPPRWRGHDLYLPLPFARRCVLSYEPSAPLAPPGGEGEVLYYQVETRTYPPGTRVRTFSPGELARAAAALQGTAAALQRASAVPDGGPDGGPDEGASASIVRRDVRLAPGEAFELDLEGPAAVRRLAVRLEPGEGIEPDQLLRSAVLAAEFDGEPCVWAPIGELAGTGAGLRPYATRFTSALPDGTLVLERPMPFARSARLRLLLEGQGGARGTLRLETGPWDWDERSLHFHAAWRAFGRVSTAGAHDEAGGAVPELTLVDVRGRGVYVGDVLSIVNGAPAWWGEGDEKIWVDGGAFPTHFGTGTEDHYGYAWAQAGTFAMPLHALVEGAGNVRGGPSVDVRHRALDAIPFQRSLRFDLELLHWEETLVDVCATTFWYARPGASSDVAPDPGAAARPVARTAEDVVPAPRVAGALEGEELLVLEAGSGRAEVVHAPRSAWSNRRQLVWRGAAPGERLVLRLSVADGGAGALSLVLGGAAAGGSFGVLLDGRTVLSGLDLRRPTSEPVTARLEGLDLAPGDHRLAFERAAGSGDLLALDYLVLEAP